MLDCHKILFNTKPDVDDSVIFVSKMLENDNLKSIGKNIEINFEPKKNNLKNTLKKFKSIKDHDFC